MKFISTLIITSIILGSIVSGIGLYTFYYAKGGSYFSKESKACINCHVMRENYDTWSRSTHHHVTQCNSCHMPRSIIPALASKAYNGFAHSLAFTTGHHPEPIRIKEINRKIVINNCLGCHEQIFKDNQGTHQSKELNCLHCHQGIGHFR